MLAQAPGFRSLYSGRYIQFEEIYYDIVDRAFLPPSKRPLDGKQKLLEMIEIELEGKVITRDEHFFLENRQGELEFFLLAEGLRKLLIVEILIELHHMGVQIFLATHEYVILKEFDLRLGKGDSITFHSLSKNKKSKNVEIHSTHNYLQIHPNAISDTFSDLYDRDVKRALLGGI